uniref:Selenoprotein K n=1 Tax=Gadus morhua TaxID=8049 RepID=A0A8C4ZJH2_GADMO
MFVYIDQISDSGLCPSGQTLGSSRSRWSFPNLAKMFWGIVEFVGLFFTTIVQSDLTKDKIVAGSSRFSDGRE